MDKSHMTEAVFMDLRKVFLTVGHAYLLSKFKYYGIEGEEAARLKVNNSTEICSSHLIISNLKQEHQLMGSGMDQSLDHGYSFCLKSHSIPAKKMRGILYANIIAIFIVNKALNRDESENVLNKDIHQLAA